jgi:Type IV secretion-system coupling protein DNA-binding domain/TraM recognition site of TraD and TraG
LMHSASAGEQLREQFLAWEQQGRGWQVWPRPVVLEPGFYPFLGYRLVKQAGAISDDGRRQTILSSFWAGLRKRLSPVAVAAAPVKDANEEFADSEPDLAPNGTGRLGFRLLLPIDFELPARITEPLVTSLSRAAFPVSYEVIATPDEASLLVTCDACDEVHLRQTFAMYAPQVGLLPDNSLLERSWRQQAPQWVVELGLSEEFLRPLRTLRDFPTDPLTGLIAVLTGLSADQVAVFQVLVQAACSPWAESGIRALLGTDGRLLPVHDPELLKEARAKFASPLVAAVVRIGVQSATDEDALVLLSRIVSALSPVDVPLGQELIPLSNDGYDDDRHEADLLLRTTCRSGMLLNVGELAALLHLPGSSIQHPRLVRFTKHTKAAPLSVVGHGLVLGKNVHLGQTREVSLPDEQRLRHVHILGASGTGKSTLLLSMIMQDIEAGRGVALLDPHGDLVDNVLARIPERRREDVVVFDPGDEDYPIAFNILAAHSERERTLLSSDLIAIFRSLSTSWGDQMNSVLANAILAFLESSTGGTLVELRRFLVNAKYRSEFLRSVSDPEIVYYWQHEFTLLRGNPQAPILTRLDAFLRPKLIRNMVAQAENRLDIARIMDEGRIVLARLSHGAIGEENSYLLGALLVAKIHQTALARQDREASARRPFFLYADEFHHFATPSMAHLLSGVRKYGLGLTLAHQELAQLGGRSDEVASAVLTNAGTRVAFRVSLADARVLAEGFSGFRAADLQNLGVGEAIARVERSDHDFNLAVTALPAVERTDGLAVAEAARAASRARYATRREDLASSPPTVPDEPATTTPPAVAIRDRAPLPAVATRPAVADRVPLPRQARSAPVSSPGRGGQQHKYLQTLIKSLGEERGFRAAVEQTVLDGHGSVDVALERDDLRIAIEISVTTPTAHELGNITKCLAAGFDHVVLVVADARSQKRLSKALDAEFGDDARKKISCVLPADIPHLLDQAAAPASTTTTVAGYKVKVQLSSGRSDEARARRQTLQSVIGRSLKRMAEPEGK